MSSYSEIKEDIKVMAPPFVKWVGITLLFFIILIIGFGVYIYFKAKSMGY